MHVDNHPATVTNYKRFITTVARHLTVTVQQPRQKWPRETRSPLTWPQRTAQGLTDSDLLGGDVNKRKRRRSEEVMEMAG